MVIRCQLKHCKQISFRNWYLNMDVTTKAKLLQQRRDYKKARAADNNHRACPTLIQEENVNHMPVTHVHPRCVDTNDEVEFDTALFEPTNHDSDDEGWFYKSVHQCSFFFVSNLLHASP